MVKDPYKRLLLVFSVTPFKIDQNKNQNRSIDKVQNVGNEYPGYQRFFLACDEVLSRPYADSSSAEDRGHERRSREKKPLAHSALIYCAGP